MADKIKLRRDTQANWEAVNPILDEGELGWITDRNTAKIGDGTQGFNNLQSIYGTPESWVNVKDFGAVGNGIHDDTEAIQNAINSLNSGIIYFPKGTYIISSSIKVNKPFINLLGSGRGSTTIKKIVDSFEGTQNLNMIININNNDTKIDFITISNMTLVGNVPAEEGNWGNPADYTMIGIHAYKAYNSSFEYINIVNVNKGFLAQDICMSNLKQIRSSYCQYGFEISDDLSGLGGTSTTLDHCIVLGPNDTFLNQAFLIRGHSHGVMINCVTDNGTGKAYNFQDSIMHLIGCALGNWKNNDELEGLIHLLNSDIIMDNFHAYSAQGTDPNSKFIAIRDNASLILNNLYKGDLLFYKLISSYTTKTSIVNDPLITTSEIGIAGRTGSVILNGMHIFQNSFWDPYEYFFKLKSSTKNWKIKIDDTGTLTTEEII